MIFYAKDLFNIANQINIDVEKEAMQSALKAQEKTQGRKKQQAETGFGVTGP
jgi:NTP pyrophosphatase (non-canonical NTP hydrolase)